MYTMSPIQRPMPYNLRSIVIRLFDLGVGEIRDDWNDFLRKLKDMDLKNKTVALFGCGDSVSLVQFCDALGVIYHELQHTGCTFTGEVDLSEYRFDGSGGVIRC